MAIINMTPFVLNAKGGTLTDKQLMLNTLIPIRLKGEANNRDHWAKKYSRQKKHQQRIKMEWLLLKPKITLPCEIHLTRHAVKNMDYDNLVYTFKYVVDAIADLITPGLAPGQADSNPKITWKYSQKKAKTYGLQIDIYA
jgi:hypothetical protein